LRHVPLRAIDPRIEAREPQGERLPRASRMWPG
jgi:hypothetical protein